MTVKVVTHLNFVLGFVTHLNFVLESLKSKPNVLFWTQYIMVCLRFNVFFYLYLREKTTHYDTDFKNHFLKFGLLGIF